jgi:hypothetical protein
MSSENGEKLIGALGTNCDPKRIKMEETKVKVLLEV